MADNLKDTNTDYLLKSYILLVEFLGKVLGPDYEIVLHDLKAPDRSIVAIANKNISGRHKGDPATNLVLEVMKEQSYKKDDYRVNYKGISKEGKFLRSSTYFIKDDEQNLIGMLCINFDCTKYINISNQILKLCHPDDLADSVFMLSANITTLTDISESFGETLSDMMAKSLCEVMGEQGVSPDRMTKQEKLEIVNNLNKKGVFLLKGAIPEVARNLACSEATVYRYLNNSCKGDPKIEP